MLTIEELDPRSRADVRRFVEFPFDLYRADPFWVPPLRTDARVALDPARHPFYEHSDARFFLAGRGGRVSGRIGVLEHRPYNRAHGTHQASFTLFDCQDDAEAARALFDRALDWARGRGLTRLVGPRGLGALDGYGVLVHGFDRPQLMTMTGYNPPYYARLLESLGFAKEVDFVSCEIDRATFVMPEAVRRAAARAESTLRIVRYPTRRALVRAARGIGDTYNRAFAGNWEYYPLSAREVDFVVGQVRPLADPRLMTFIAAGDAIVGFVLAFPDVSRALRAARGAPHAVGRGAAAARALPHDARGAERRRHPAGVPGTGRQRAALRPARARRAGVAVRDRGTAAGRGERGADARGPGAAGGARDQAAPRLREGRVSAGRGCQRPRLAASGLPRGGAAANAVAPDRA
jgi:hypothetical protein